MNVALFIEVDAVKKKFMVTRLELRRREEVIMLPKRSEFKSVQRRFEKDIYFIHSTVVIKTLLKSWQQFTHMDLSDSKSIVQYRYKRFNICCQFFGRRRTSNIIAPNN
uniref:Uncharacterized protein n=1 Tax=Magallana gigas TaxID=29159 RepID=K1RAY6_MAGGI